MNERIDPARTRRAAPVAPSPPNAAPPNAPPPNAAPPHAASPHAAPPNAAPSDAAFARLGRIAQHLAGGTVDAAEVENELLFVLAELIEANAAAIVDHGTPGTALRRLAMAPRLAPRRAAIEAEVRAAADTLAAKADPGGGYATPSRHLSGEVVLAAPAGATSVLVATTARTADLAGARATLQLGALTLARIDEAAGGAQRDPFAVLSALEAEADTVTAPETLADLLRRLTEARQVILAGPRGAVAAMAPSGEFDARSSAGRAVTELLRRTAEAGRPELGAAAAEGLAPLGARSLVALPIRDGAAALLVDPGRRFAAFDETRWQAVARAIPAERAWGGRRRAPAKALAGRALKLAALAALVAALFVPVPDRIRAEAVLEPAEQRILTASFSAILDATTVENGDPVRRGQTVATLEGEELRLSEGAAAARVREAERRRDAALRDGRVTEAALADADRAEAEAERDLLAWRIARLDLKAPVDGVVLDNAFHDMRGAPLREGDTILTIAPTDALRVRAHVPVADLERLPDGARGEIHVDGAAGTVGEIGPLRAEPKVTAWEGSPVLPLTAPLANADGRFHPGQTAVVLIPTGSAPLGMVLFRRSWLAMQRWFR